MGYLRVTRHGLGFPNTYEILCPWRQNPDPQNLRVSAAESAGQARNDCGSLDRQDVRGKDSLSDSPAALLVSDWFSTFRQAKPTARERATCLNIMHGLIGQGYTVEEVRVGIALVCRKDTGAAAPGLAPRQGHRPGRRHRPPGSRRRATAVPTPGPPSCRQPGTPRRSERSRAAHRTRTRRPGDPRPGNNAARRIRSRPCGRHGLSAESVNGGRYIGGLAPGHRRPGASVRRRRAPLSRSRLAGERGRG
jgi:hypothetical protein